MQVERHLHHTLIRLTSSDGTNRLSAARVIALTDAIGELGAATSPQPLVLAGNERFFSAGAELKEIATLTAPRAFRFARLGQRLMETIVAFPAPTCAAIEGYCMGGGLDLALACELRAAAPRAIFGHRGAALGLMTGWGGTQRLPRLIGRGRALQMLLAAEKIGAREAFRIGLIDAVADDPIAHAITFCTARCSSLPADLR